METIVTVTPKSRHRHLDGGRRDRALSQAAMLGGAA
jgi:hypothetical protein